MRGRRTGGRTLTGKLPPHGSQGPSVGCAIRPPGTTIRPVRNIYSYQQFERHATETRRPAVPYQGAALGIGYIDTSGRHSSKVEQLLRKSPALCAVLPSVGGRPKSAHL